MFFIPKKLNFLVVVNFAAEEFKAGKNRTARIAINGSIIRSSRSVNFSFIFLILTSSRLKFCCFRPTPLHTTAEFSESDQSPNKLRAQNHRHMPGPSEQDLSSVFLPWGGGGERLNRDPQMGFYSLRRLCRRCR